MQNPAGWYQLDTSGLTAEPQAIDAVAIAGGRAVFFTATDSYVWGALVPDAGPVTLHRFFDRADHYWSGFNISTQQPVTVIDTGGGGVDVLAIGLDEVVWYQHLNLNDFAADAGWRTLLDFTTFTDGGRFQLPQTIGQQYDGHALAMTVDNTTYQTCYPFDPNQFRWVPLGYDCPPYIVPPR